MTTALQPVEQTTRPGPQLVHVICGICHPEVYTGQLSRPTAALCGHVVSPDARYWTGVEPTCVVCDDLETTHVCLEHR